MQSHRKISGKYLKPIILNCREKSNSHRNRVKNTELFFLIKFAPIYPENDRHASNARLKEASLMQDNPRNTV